MNELNKKLAQWAGITFYVGGWKYPDGSTGCSVNFTESLDACVEWLVPNLLYVAIGFEIGANPKAIVLGKNDKATGEAETLALALCLAIEKLIEES